MVIKVKANLLLELLEKIIMEIKWIKVVNNL